MKHSIPAPGRRFRLLAESFHLFGLYNLVDDSYARYYPV